MSTTTLWLLDGLLVAICLLVLFVWAKCFPFPSPWVRPLLPPKARWPETLIRYWLRNGNFSKGYLRYFYRDPERTIPLRPGIVAPADGLITSLEALNGIRYVVIALSFWDMHIQRSPLQGEVMDVQDLGDDFLDGEGRDFAFLREKTCPVQKRVVIETERGRVAVRLITSLAARRIEVWVRAGERVERGERIGKILLGSTVVLEVPDTWSLGVRVGDRVLAGETLFES